MIQPLSHSSLTIESMTAASQYTLTELKSNIETRQARVGIVGMGYVGLPLALLFSGERFRVTGFDIAPEKVAALNAGGGGAVLIVLDSDDDCPATLAAELLARARHTVRHLPISVVLPKREFEAWFLAAAESLRGVRGLSEELAGPPDPEAVRGAKEWLSDRMVTGRKYRETLDQAALTARFDMAAARRADSFDKLCREVRRLIAVAGQTNL